MSLQKKKITDFIQEDETQITYDEEDQTLLSNSMALPQKMNKNDFLSEIQHSNFQNLKSIENEYVLVNSLFGDMNLSVIEQQQLIN